MTHKPHMTLENGEKLFEGEYGITRDGDRVGPVMQFGTETYPWNTTREEYTDNGKYYPGGTNGEDIIARAETDISLDTLENLTTPLGLLDDATRKALEAHGGPYEWFDGGSWGISAGLSVNRLAHRVKRQPKVETDQVALVTPSGRIGWAAIDKIDGEYDLTTVRPWVEGEV